MLPVFPLQGYAPLTRDPGAWARHLALPTLAIGVERGAVLTRLVRASLLEELGRDYVRTARGKGVAERVVFRRHVLQNAAIPVLTVGGLQLGYLLGGAIIIEQVFGIPGLGRLLLQGIYARDPALVQGAVLVIALLFAGVNVIVDVLYTRLDPRIHYAA
jgi:peptide/nickel transport system permease protein